MSGSDFGVSHPRIWYHLVPLPSYCLFLNRQSLLDGRLLIFPTTVKLVLLITCVILINSSRLERVLNFHKHGSLRSLSCLNGSPRIAIGCEKALILGTHVIEHHKAEKNVLQPYNTTRGHNIR
ncbi:hypothetical protein PVAP13_8KG018128 [Panicum virgatum]|uniref:Uncharacterized protein n=1 Tax=Panicum virgatum TaxID=38727 RepID=A0A8T0PF59_PANVG|nr:hypothetical protein PVAP13_8KG018128 [Panicum virgatum]